VSHVIDCSPDELTQKLRHMHALQMACECSLTKSGKQALRLRLPAGAQIGADGHLYRGGKRLEKGNEHYRTWKDDHGRLVGDWPVPKGMTADQVGENGVAVIELTEDGIKELPHRQDVKPYQVGVIPHVNEEGDLTYSLTHDFFAGGYGLEHYIGQTKLNNKGDKSQRVESAHELILMYYQMMAAKIAAQEAGHDIEFVPQDDGTYVAVVDKQGVGVTA
jgi:hypothetical protein